MPVTAPARNCRRWAGSLIPIVSRWRRKSTSRRALRAALQSAGANPHALDLLLLALHPDESAFDGDEITDPDALLTPLKAQYGAFFAQPTRLPTDVVSPPVTAAPPLTKEDVRRMSQEDINRNWSIVCSVLSKGD